MPIAMLARKKRLLFWSVLLASLLFVGAGIFFVLFVLKLRPVSAALPLPMVKQMRVPTGSMLPTLKVGEMVNVNLMAHLTEKPRLGDIVVFPAPAIALHPGQGQVWFFKRCVGLPGNVIEMKGGKLYRDGMAVTEPYAAELDNFGKPMASADVKDFQRDFKLVQYQGKYWPLTIYGRTVNGEMGRTATEFYLNDQETMDELLALPSAKIPPGFCIVIGDNRANSYDSRSWGLVDLNTVVGRVEK